MSEISKANVGGKSLCGNAGAGSAAHEARHTMDIGEFFGDSTLRAVLFAHPDEQPVYFEFFGQPYSLLLCIGIPTEEQAYARSRSTAEVLALLRQQGVFPHTIPGRPSVLLPRSDSLWGRMFGR